MLYFSTNKFKLYLEETNYFSTNKYMLYLEQTNYFSTNKYKLCLEETNYFSTNKYKLYLEETNYFSTTSTSYTWKKLFQESVVWSFVKENDLYFLRTLVRVLLQYDFKTAPSTYLACRNFRSLMSIYVVNQ